MSNPAMTAPSAAPASSRSGNAPRTTLGLERLLGQRFDLIAGQRIGVICNQASVDRALNHAADLFVGNRDLKVKAFFGPQHGIRGDVQDNMIETPHDADRVTGLPVYSLYSETREPTAEMLAEIDTLVFDLQDVGCRIYTFIYTLANCMRVAGKLGKKVVVCDRPNPINGVQTAGNVLEPEFASFVGLYPIPTRHGMTVGELGNFFNEQFNLGCDLEVVTMEGWEREMWFEDTGAPFVMPSPNIPTVDSCVVFPGTVHLEGTQMSEGRGTTRPFELIGAPYIDAAEYARRLERIGLPGVHFRATYFQPSFQKHAKVTCGGVQIHVTDRAAFEPVIAGIATVQVAYSMYPDKFLWKDPPYEYEFTKNPFDVISGTKRMREQIESGQSLDVIQSSWTEGLDAFRKTRERYLLY